VYRGVWGRGVADQGMRRGGQGHGEMRAEDADEQEALFASLSASGACGNRGGSEGSWVRATNQRGSIGAGRGNSDAEASRRGGRIGSDQGDVVAPPLGVAGAMMNVGCVDNALTEALRVSMQEHLDASMGGIMGRDMRGGEGGSPAAGADHQYHRAARSQPVAPNASAFSNGGRGGGSGGGGGGGNMDDFADFADEDERLFFQMALAQSLQ
jgi:hypothetical protein